MTGSCVLLTSHFREGRRWREATDEGSRAVRAVLYTGYHSTTPTLLKAAALAKLRVTAFRLDACKG
jgi:hypothetical protein